MASSSSGRYTPYARRGGVRKEHEPAVFYKDVCLIPDPLGDRVPQGKVKAFYINKIMYVECLGSGERLGPGDP